MKWISKIPLILIFLMCCGEALADTNAVNTPSTSPSKPAPPTPDSSKSPNKKKSWWERQWNSAKNFGLKSKKKAQSASQVLGKSRAHRSERPIGLFGNYSYLDLWVPSKIGATIAYSPSPSESWEIEYLRASYSLSLFIVDLGSFTDQRISILRRHYGSRNSFSYTYGFFYNQLKATLGDDLLASVNSQLSRVDVVNIQTAGLSFGLGNRWVFSGGLTIGVDWFVLSLPLVSLKSEVPYLSSTNSSTDREKVQDAVDIIKKFPTFSALKFQIGVHF